MASPKTPVTPNPNDDGYSADDIQMLEGLEAVRKRPGMYIGSTDGRGLQHCMWEIIDNSVDEAIAGHCTHIDVILHADHSVEVQDNGRGIPTGVNAKTGLTGVELVLTKLHAGGKFGGSGYAVSGGLHGVGASVVNALSSRLDVFVDRDGVTNTMSFERGEPGLFDDDGEFTSFSGLTVVAGAKPTTTGTRVRYWADRTIFLADADIDLDRTHDRARQTAFLVPGLEIVVTDDRGDGDAAVETFRFDGGTRDFVEFIAPDLPICDPIVITGSASFEETVPVLENGQMVSRTVTRDLGVDVAIRWGTGYEQHLRSFVNIIATPKGGTHVTGFERAVTKALVETATANKAVKANEESPLKEDVLEGLSAIVCVRLAEPQFEGQTKEILGTAAATKIVTDIVTEGLRTWAAAKATKNEARKVSEKVALAARTRRALRLQKETIRRKNALESSSLPAKLADCRSDDLERCEILIVEGDSAMGCGLGNTLVSTIFGGPRTLKELADDWELGITHYGYATDAAGAVVVVPLLEPRLTKHGAQLVEVTLDNGEELIFTPDHPFRLRDGSYRRADSLVQGVSLMPLYRRLTPSGHPVGEGYEEVLNNATGKWELTHRLADRYNLENGLDPKENGTSSHHAGELIDAAQHTNHSVASVRHLDYTADVYDLTVDVHHNFALEAGIFVHNSTKAARDSEYQALMPIRGKILNTYRATEKQMLDNAECAAIITVMGAGSGKSFDINSIRYGKFIILADADVDGSHIRCLLMTLCFRYMRPLLEAGRVYAAVPPLFGIQVAGAREKIYTHTAEGHEQKLLELEQAGKTIKDIQRYKGLGEMDAAQLAETTIDQNNRILRRITFDDAEAASEMFEILMGSNVGPRRDFIVDNALSIDRDSLDI